ncbi:15838_t:CDS:2 [Gigaspora margarita]|uniref:15838_t:CDS:1 n=1 Tax=Gigaspora margarita TaxID=4874 RepID=A0ABM8W431_GIGMA|nr:15838_t:CDS:2 [Gigaspora margarita]
MAYQSDSEDDLFVHSMSLKKAQALINNPRSHQVITLASCGKKVGVCEVGDPEGYPVLWLTAMSILLYHNLAKRHHIRLISVDRPGYNDSDDIYSRCGVPDLFEFADMINELTLILKMWQFGMATFSLGAVYGLAYSLSFPERIKGPIFTISPWVSTSTPGHLLYYKGRSYIHKKIYQNGLWNLQNRTGAHIDAMVALEKVDWGYKYEDTTYPIQAFVGEQDDNVPLQAWTYMNNKMNNLELNVVKDGGHYLLYRMDFMEELFTTIETTVKS